MPNWCRNDLDIVGQENVVNDFIEVAKLEIDEGIVPLCFANLYPEPDYDKNPSEDSSVMPDWYNWRIENWGTKWDLDINTQFDSGIGWASYVFDTAWSPPLELFDVVAGDYPALKFTLTFGEMGMWFSGRTVWQTGKRFSHIEGEYEAFFPEEAEQLLEYSEE